MRIRILRKLRDEKGATPIVEATIVFPVMFLILFFLIYLGNAYFIKARVTAAVETYAIEGAKRCADPLLSQIEKNNGVVPSISKLNTKPYRYLLGSEWGGMNAIAKDISGELYSKLTSSGFSFFKNMKPVLKTGKDNMARYNNKIVYSTFIVEVKYEIVLPIKILDKGRTPIMKLSARSEMPITDSAEFIRNVDMVIDYTQGTKVGQAISKFFGKINDVISKFAKK